MKKRTNLLIKIVSAIFISISFGFVSYFYFPWKSSYSYNSKNGTIGDIPCPNDFLRCDYGDFAMYMRSFPLSNPEDSLKLYTGEYAADSLQEYVYNIIDLPLISKYEQCADVCIRLRTEYLFHTRQFLKIHFQDTQYNTKWYKWGAREDKIKGYLNYIYLIANTESLIHEMRSRRLEDMQPGDVFVYDAKSRAGAKYGHAMMVADVAKNQKTGEKLFMIIQGSTPACNIFILENTKEPNLSPWFKLDPKAETIDLGFASYNRNELRFFEN